MTRRWLSALLLAPMLIASSAVRADGPAISDFVGSYTGTGVTNSRDAVTLGLVKRDLDVAIDRQGDGFTVRWTTVTYQDYGTGTGPQVNRSSTAMRFRPGASPGIFYAAGHADPMAPEGYAWANINARALSVTLLVIDGGTGRYDLHIYSRTLTGGDDMELEFTRIRSGKPRVIVQGTLTRLAR